MYNSLIIIICVFSVYGIYSFLRELSVSLTRKSKVTAAIEATDDEEFWCKLSIAEFYAQRNKCFSSRAVILCDNENFERYLKYGLEVYVRKSGKESHGGEQNHGKC